MIDKTIVQLLILVPVLVLISLKLVPVSGDLLRWKEGRMLWDPVRVPQLQPGSTLTILFIAIFMFSTNKCSHAEASHNRSYSPLNWIVRSNHPEIPIPSHLQHHSATSIWCHLYMFYHFQLALLLLHLLLTATRCLIIIWSLISLFMFMIWLLITFILIIIWSLIRCCLAVR